MIAQAIGILSATELQTDEEALESLRALALASGHSMRTVAGWIIEERPKGTAPSVGDQPPDV